MDVLSSNHQPQSSMADPNVSVDGDNAEEEKSEHRVWKSDPVTVNKDQVYRFGFELTVPKAIGLCYFTPFEDRHKEFF